MVGSRLLLQDSIHDEFVERPMAIASKAKLGDPAPPDVQVGPVATRPQFDKVMGYFDAAKAEGAKCVLGGNVRSGPGFGAGQFVELTIFTGVDSGMHIAQQEVFGPMLCGQSQPELGLRCPPGEGGRHLFLSSADAHFDVQTHA